MQHAKNFPNHEDNIKITANSDTKNIFPIFTSATSGYVISLITYYFDDIYMMYTIFLKKFVRNNCIFI